MGRWKGNVLAICVLTLLVLFQGCEGVLTGSSDIVKAIPTNAAFIVKIGHPEKMDTLLAGKPYETVVREKLLLPSMMANHAAFSAFLIKSGYTDSTAVVPMVASIHLESAVQMNSLHYYPLQTGRKKFAKILAARFPAAAVQQWNYEGVDFNEVLIPGTETKLTLAYSQGILIASPVSFLVEDAVKQLKSAESLLSDAEFRKVYNQETGDAAANIWFPFENAKHWISLFAAYGSEQRLQPMADFASWMLLDIYFNDEDIFLSGITAAAKGKRLAELGGKSPCEVFPGKLLPYNTASYFHYGNTTDSLSATLEKMGLEKCWSRLLIEPLNTRLDEHWIYLFRIRSKETWQEKARTKELTSSFFRKNILNGERAFFEQTDDYIAVASSKQQLANYLGNVANGQVLEGDEAFSQLAGSMAADAPVTLYFRPVYNRESFRSLYESEQRATDDFNALRGFNQVAFQFSKARDVLETTAYMTYSENAATGQSNLAWVTNLEGPVLAGPRVIAIDQKGGRGVLVQDTGFNLYLLDHSGAILWKKDLGSKWLGTAYSLGLFKDKAVQITLNTETEWHLWDVSGKPLAGFPLHFKESAMTGMALYQDSEKTRAFIPLKNGSIYGYEINGRPLPGWNPQDRVGIISQPLQITLEGKTPYITAFNDDGTAYIWDMSGKRKARNQFGNPYPSAHFIDELADPVKLKNVGTDGELVSINLDDKVGRYQLQASGIQQFFMANITGNTEPEIVLSDGAHIYVFSYTGQLVWKKAYSGRIAPVALEAQAAHRISLYDPSDRTISILDAKGNVIWKTSFAIGEYYQIAGPELLGTGHPALVTSGGENEVYCYRFSLVAP